ncbi:MAG: SufE family protein [Armatimonadota bacterium]
MPIPAKLQEYLDDLSIFTDRQDHIEYLIALSDDYKHPDSSSFVRSEEKKVPGCESEVFIEAIPEGSSLNYRFAVDNPQGISAMAMAAILQSSLSGALKEEIAAVEEDVVFKIFGNELSMGKNLGLTNMIRIVKRLAH